MSERSARTALIRLGMLLNKLLIDEDFVWSLNGGVHAYSARHYDINQHLYAQHRSRFLLRADLSEEQGE